MEDNSVTSGYLVVKTFERMYREFHRPAEEYEELYSIPREKVPFSEIRKKYRGIARDPIQPWIEELRGSGCCEPIDSELAACLFMEELRQSERAHDDFIFDLGDVVALLQRISPPTEREVIWARRTDRDPEGPMDSALLGFDPTFFYPSEHFSAIADCMCFPAWHGCDAEGTLFLPYHDQLNEHALFDTPELANEFLSFYLSQEWTERGEFYIAEIRAIPLTV